MAWIYKRKNLARAYLLLIIGATVCNPLEFGRGIKTSVSLQQIPVCYWGIPDSELFWSYLLLKIPPYVHVQQVHLAQHTAVLDVQ